MGTNSNCENTLQCLNNGECVKVDSGYICRCVDGFSGDVCENNPIEFYGICIVIGLFVIFAIFVFTFNLWYKFKVNRLLYDEVTNHLLPTSSTKIHA